MSIAEDDFKNIYKTVYEGVLILDENMRVLSANSSFFKIFNLNIANTIGSLLYDLGNGQWKIPELRILLMDILPKSATVDNYEIEYRFDRTGQDRTEQKTLLLNACKIEQTENMPPMIVLAIADITEHKRLENLLAESEERYRRLFETTTDGIVLLEKREGHIVNANPATEKMLGYSREYSIGKNLQEIGIPIDTSDFPAIIQALSECDIINYDDVQAKTKSGVNIVTDIYLVDRTALVQCHIRNVTEKKKLENQLRHAVKMEGIGTLAGGIAHDFNNILSAIIGYGHLTLLKMPKDDPLRLNIEHMLESADRATALTQSLLTFSRKQITDRKPVDLNKIINKVEKFLVRVISEDVLVRLVLAEGELIILADAGQMEQMLMNLATNARDAMPNGGSFTIETSNIDLDSLFVKAHGYGKPGSYAMISVTDTGIGMNEETKIRIFEPFFTTKEVGKGTGLGLAMVYGIIKQQEGFINVYSEQGKGTTFRIYLPLIKTVAVEERNAIDVEYPIGGTETILLAEDDVKLRKLSVLVLEQMGYTVITANDGEEAIKKFMENKDRIQLLLFDIVMPKKSGKEAFKEIRNVMPNVPVIFASGYSPDMLREKDLIDNGAVLVYKPILPQILLKKVREVLDRKR